MGRDLIIIDREINGAQEANSNVTNRVQELDGNNSDDNEQEQFD